MSARDPYSAYKQNEIQGASQGKLIILMYDGAIRFLKQACVYIEKKDINGAHENIMRAENILAELMNTLNMDAGEVADNLLRLYEFMLWHLIQANKDKDQQKVEEVISMLADLRGAWNQIVHGQAGELSKPEKSDKTTRADAPDAGEGGHKKLNISL
ncbi:flagellar export chaperone FliS [Desulfurispirillum indicum]|uniref:Flagellar protein FliS n=1 Tax=Desulfurispirillum indicum (strain ATCC BAA-1389 / DSM 22839 / S5) TaxID=653733 RepID=E6W1U1_DESIS|nr:flagellar export chaperone FliS [Desulfurispirillum indicum]ADU65473.1 flagellar protein FliS [Desulfurispirillum indicum S5]UCZ57393.1 flagellar export chaperone FliS [Desulfurispirillum indicum]